MSGARLPANSGVTVLRSLARARTTLLLPPLLTDTDVLEEEPSSVRACETVRAGRQQPRAARASQLSIALSTESGVSRRRTAVPATQHTVH